LEAAPEPFTYDALAGVGVFFVLATYFVMGCVGAPLLLLAMWRHWVSLWHIVAIGAFSGFFAAVLPIWPLLTDHRLHLHFRLARLADGYPFILLGVAGGAVFWFLALSGTPTSRRGARSPDAKVKMPPNPSIERTSQRQLRALCAAAHVKRYAPTHAARPSHV
jgi:hypothetical protein